MKILVISTLYPPYVIGGAEKAAALLAEALARRGFEVVVICQDPETGERLEEQNGVRVYRIPLDNFYWPFNRVKKPGALLRIAWHLREMWNLKAARRIGRILDIESPDVVHTHNISGFSVAVWREVKRRKIRLVHTLHDYYLMCPRTTLFRRSKACEKRCTDCKALTWNRRKASEMPDTVVSVSNYTRDYHKNLGYFNNVPSAVIYNIQVERNTSAPLLSPSDPNILTFGFIGRLEEEKGIEVILEATKHLTKSNWRLKVAGRGIEAYADSLRRRFDDPRIDWLGFTAAPSFYSAIDVVVIPSQWAEPLPYVCVEALHAGKSMICAQVGGLPEIATLSRTFRLFAANSLANLVDAMNNALDNLSEWKGYGSHKEIFLDQFREDTVLAQYIRTYSAEPANVELTI